MLHLFSYLLEPDKMALLSLLHGDVCSLDPIYV